jgi:hypothetical protein
MSECLVFGKKLFETVLTSRKTTLQHRSCLIARDGAGQEPEPEPLKNINENF